MRRRGHALLLVLTVVAAAAVAAAVFTTRLSVNFNARQADALRLQTLWLGRSACSAQLVGPRSVKTEQGTASVTRTGSVVKVALAGSSATVDCGSHEERYQQSPSPRGGEGRGEGLQP